MGILWFYKDSAKQVPYKIVVIILDFLLKYHNIICNLFILYHMISYKYLMDCTNRK